MTSTAKPLAERDLTLDLARVTCVVLVIVVHLLFTGVLRGDAGIQIERTVELQAWFPAVSWIAEIMPLFFVVGGFASRVGWRSAERRGDDAGAFARIRLARLARPALPVFIFFAVALTGATLAGVDPALLDGIAVGVGSPLWFLAAYMIVQAFAPLMIRLHERRPIATILTLIALAVVTDVIRMSVGVMEVGLPNVAFVWLAVQQFGFFLADGWFAKRAWWFHVVVVIAGYGLMLPIVAFGGYSWNMLSNQYPPTVPLLMLGFIQACLLTLLRRPLSALMATKPARGVVFLLGSRLMTVYLWHLPVILILTGIQLLLPLPMSVPGSASWWIERIPFFVAVLAIVWIFSLFLVRFENVPELSKNPGNTRIFGAVILFIISPFLVMVFGLDIVFAWGGVVGTVGALLLARIPLQAVRTRPIAPKTHDKHTSVR